MDYLQKAKNEIRNKWFENHVIKSIKGEEGFQKVIWGEPGTSMYQVIYVLSGNMVYISGDLGVAAYELSETAKLQRLGQYDLSYFTGKLAASQHSKYKFDSKKAQKEIKEFFIDWCDVDSIDELSPEDGNLYAELISETINWGMTEHFNTAVYHVYQNTNVGWFDSEAASCIADCGKRLSYSLISYWVGLQMIAELQHKEKEKAETKVSQTGV